VSVYQVSTDIRIAMMAQNQEYHHALALGYTDREAVASAVRVREEILSIARRSD